MSSLNHAKPVFTNKENAPLSSNIYMGKKVGHNIYRKVNEVLSKPSSTQYRQDPLTLQPTSLQVANPNHNLPMKGYKEAEIVKKLNAHRLKKTLVAERSSYNGRPGNIMLAQKDRYSVTGKEGRMSVVERGERYSVDGPTRTSFVETQRSQITEPAQAPLLEKEPMKLNPVLEPAVKQEKHEEEIVAEKISTFVNENEKKKKTTSEKVDCKEQCDKILEEYASDIMESLIMKDKESTPAFCLKNHKIPINLRAKMVDWMVEVLGSYKCLDQTFFIAANLMDSFLEKTKNVQEVSDLHLLGVTCMFMASKYEEIYPLRLSIVYEKIAHKKISPEQIKQKEMEVFSTLEYKMTNVTPYEFMMNTIFQLNLKDTMSPKLYDYLLKVCTYLSKANMHDYELVSQQNYSELAAATLFVAFKIIEQLDKTFPLAQMLAKIKEILQVEEDIVYDCATRVLSVAKNFEKLYPNLENLKRFHSFNFDEITAYKTNDEKSRNRTTTH